MRGRRRTSPKSRAGGILSNYLLTTATFDFNAVGSGTDNQVVILDNSAKFGNIPVRVVKSKTQIMWDADVVDDRLMIFAVYRAKEGATALSLDDEDVVKNATQAGQFYRRPYLTHSNPQQFAAGGHMDHFWKPLILKNVLLDDDDDLLLGWTNPDANWSGSTQTLQTRTEAWWKRV